MADLQSPSIELTAPFANNGDRNEIKELEKDADIGRANLETGFPKLSGTPLDEGGIPPAREDFNAILNILSDYALTNTKNIDILNDEISNNMLTSAQLDPLIHTYVQNNIPEFDQIIDDFIKNNNIKVNPQDIIDEINKYVADSNKYSNFDGIIDDYLSRNPVTPTDNNIFPIIRRALKTDQLTKDAVFDLVESAVKTDQPTIDAINDLIAAEMANAGIGITAAEIVQHITDAIKNNDSVLMPELNKILTNSFKIQLNAIDFDANTTFENFRKQILKQIQKAVESDSTTRNTLTALINNLIQANQASIPRTDRFDDTNNPPNINDTSHTVSPKYVYLLFKWMTNKPASWDPSMGDVLEQFGDQIIGVVDTGVRTIDGAVLEYIDKDFNIVSNLTPGYFDNHDSFKFTETTIGNDIFIKIPVAYWRRGFVPSGYDLTGKWYMQISPIPFTDFNANEQAFNYNSVRRDAFYFGKYRAGWDTINNKIVSQPNTKFYGNVTFNDFRSQAKASGEGYMMQSIFHFHEILARMVIEKKTFNISPIENSSNPSDCIYRGIEHLFYYGSHPDAGGTAIINEWIDGIRFSADYYIEHFAPNNDGSWVKTNKRNTRSTSTSNAQIGNYKIYKLFADSGNTKGLDYIFLNDVQYSYSQTSSDLDGEKTMIPYMQYWGLSSANMACLEWSETSGFGAFGFNFKKTANEAQASIGSRLVKM